MLPEPKKNLGKNEWALRALAAFSRISIWIAWPIVAGALLASWLEERYGLGQGGMLAIIGIAFIVSIIGVTRTARIEAAKMEDKIAGKPGDQDKNHDDQSGKSS